MLASVQINEEYDFQNKFLIYIFQFNVKNYFLLFLFIFYKYQ